MLEDRCNVREQKRCEQGLSLQKDCKTSVSRISTSTCRILCGTTRVLYLGVEEKWELNPHDLRAQEERRKNERLTRKSNRPRRDTPTSYIKKPLNDLQPWPYRPYANTGRPNPNMVGKEKE